MTLKETSGEKMKTTDSSALTLGTLVCVYGPLSDTPNFKVGQTVDIDQVHLVKKGVK